MFVLQGNACSLYKAKGYAIGIKTICLERKKRVASVIKDEEELENEFLFVEYVEVIFCWL
jgi:hypothetical protein